MGPCVLSYTPTLNTGTTYEFSYGTLVAFDPSGVEYDHDVGFGKAITGFARTSTVFETPTTYDQTSTYAVFYMEGNIGATIVSDTAPTPSTGPIVDYALGGWSYTASGSDGYFDSQSGDAGTTHYLSSYWVDVGPATPLTTVSIAPASASLP